MHFRTFFSFDPKSAASRLSPGSFSIVMATGIVSISAHLMGHDFFAKTLFLLNAAIYAVLFFLNLLRMFRFRRRFLLDLHDHRRAPGFFTVVAGTSVMGSQFILIQDEPEIALFLWSFGLLLWFISTYCIFAALIVKTRKPSIEPGINGGWLLAVVAPQSISVLGALLSTHFREHVAQLDFLALCLWLWGGMLYLWLITQIFQRLMFLKFPPADLDPAYWINMGAIAISTLAGSLLITNAPDFPLLLDLLPFLKGATLGCWVTGTWWIPMLFLLESWKNGRIPFAYSPSAWSAVFPAGMYAASTFQLAAALDLKFLRFLPPLSLYVAAALWVAACFRLARRQFSPSHS
ncbi:MAG: C4-dicarboxylate ABC transporter [Burkholderiales bacterium]|nr:C4-dicarboxylate ABC transporter [Burkholderiales bacterium]